MHSVCSLRRRLGKVINEALYTHSPVYCAVQYNTVQCSTVHEHPVQCSAIQYYSGGVRIEERCMPKGRLTLCAPPSHRIPQQTFAPPLAKTCPSRFCCAEISQKLCGLKQNSLNGFIALLSAAQLSSAKCFLFAY